MAWEILYDGRPPFTSEDGAYWEAPRFGVLMVLQDDEAAGVKMLHSSDGWWIWKDGQWFGVDRDGKDDYRRTHIHPEICILEGRWVTDAEWARFQEKITERKSAWYRYERRVKRGEL